MYARRENESTAVSALQAAMSDLRLNKFVAKTEESIGALNEQSPRSISTGSSDRSSSGSRIDSLVNYHASVLELRLE